MKDEIKKELEGLSPKLAKLQAVREMPEIPNNLFNNMQLGVIQEIQKGTVKTPVSKKESWWRLVFKPIPALAFATLLALVAVGIFFNTEKSTEQFAIDDLSDEEIFAYLDSNIEDFESVSLLQITDEEEEILLESDIDDDAFEEYLDNHSENLDDEAFEHLF